MRTLDQLLLLIGLASCAAPQPPPRGADRAPIRLHVEAEGGEAAALPRAATCEGAGSAPAIGWGPLPAGAVELLLLVRARSGALHWSAWGISADQSGLPAGIVAEQAPPLQGLNEAGIIGWLAPCRPPSPVDDELLMQIIALREPLRAPPTTGVDELLRRAEPLIIGQGELRLPIWTDR